MTKFCFIDFETNGKDPLTCNPTEVGALLVEKLDGDKWIQLESYNSLIYESHYPPQPETIVELTGITDEMLKSEGKHPREVVAGLMPLINECDAIVAHKSYFDMNVLRRMLQGDDKQLVNSKFEWCTLSNFPWPAKYTCHKLAHLAYDHGIVVHPDTLHRAVDDVTLLTAVVAKYKFEDVLAYAKTPWAYFKGEVCKPWHDGGAQSEVAKELGFGWEKVRHVEEYKWDKTWVARVKANKVDEFKQKIADSKCPFRIVQVEGLS